MFDPSTSEMSSEGGTDGRYDYQALDRSWQEIRLLEVQPAEPADVLVRCSLRHANLRKEERKSAYETISYVWGNAHKLDTVIIDDKRCVFPASSAAAIRRIRSSNAVRTVWIDAICIDQSNLDERAQQVVLMGEIYRNSVGNIVYLGDCDDENSTRLALRDIQTILQEMNEDTDDLRSIDASPRKAESGLRSPVDFEQLVGCIFALPWFRRLWVVQEAVLAPSNTCFYGPFQFDLLDLIRAAKWLQYKELYMRTCVTSSVNCINAWILWDLADRPYGSRSTGKLMVSHLLEKARHFDVSVQVDRVYGMLGLKKWPNGIPRLLKPDYHRPYHEVVRDAARFALQEYDRGIWLLKNVYVSSNEELEKASPPTWVLSLERGNPACQPVAFCHKHFRCASAQLQPWPKSSSGIDLDVLEVAGFVLCTVEQTTPELTNEVWSDAGRRRAWIKCCLSLLQEKMDDLSVARLLIGAVNAEFTLATIDDLSAWADLKATILEENHDSTRLSLLDSPGELVASVARYELALLNVCKMRRVFRTSAGYVGVGSRVTARGDVVAIFCGGYMPYLLRMNSDQKCRCLGECYIESEDIMHGKKTRSLQQEGVPSEILRIG